LTEGGAASVETLVAPHRFRRNGHHIEVDPWNTNRVWVAMDLGVYQSLNAGASWADFSASLPNAIIGDIVFHPYARVLRAGTRNRGVWEIPVDGWMVDPICGLQFLGSLPANTTQRWFTFNWPATWHIVWTVMPTTINPERRRSHGPFKWSEPVRNS
jgi:hypothetical protein